MVRIFLFGAFIVFPILELALLIKLGGILGFWPTLAIIIGTALVGSSVIQRQGFAVLRRAQQALAEGRPPIEPVLDGMFLFIAGLLLITPGLISDIIGLILLVPPVRKLIAHGVLRLILNGGRVKGTVFTRRNRGVRPEHEQGAPRHQEKGAPRHSAPAGEPPTIEGEYERIDDSVAPPGSTGSKPPAS